MKNALLLGLSLLFAHTNAYAQDRVALAITGSGLIRGPLIFKDHEGRVLLQLDRRGWIKLKAAPIGSAATRLGRREFEAAKPTEK